MSLELGERDQREIVDNLAEVVVRDPRSRPSLIGAISKALPSVAIGVLLRLLSIHSRDLTEDEAIEAMRALDGLIIYEVVAGGKRLDAETAQLMRRLDPLPFLKALQKSRNPRVAVGATEVVESLLRKSGVITGPIERRTLARTTLFVAGTEGLSIRFSQADIEALGLLGKERQDDVDAVTGVGDVGELRSIKRSGLLAAVQRLLDRLEKEMERLTRTYALKIVEGPHAGHQGPGMVGGIELPGDRDQKYAIDAGSDYCRLLKWRAETADDLDKGEATDIRHVKTLKTTNMGEITIYRRKRRLNLRKSLPALRDFLSRQQVPLIYKLAD
jgi:hypothetical protein